MKKVSAKKVLVSCCGIALCLLIGFGIYCRQYPIKDDMSFTAIRRIVADRFEPGENTYFTGASFDNKNYMYLTIAKNQLTVVHLQAGPFGRLKYVGMSYGDTLLCDGIIEVKGEKYAVIGGKNLEPKIAALEFSLGDLTYRMPLTIKGDLFFESVKIDAATDEKRVPLESIRLYDSFGADITAQYKLTSGGL